MGNREQDDSPWADPAVKSALNSGCEPSDIALLLCPICGVFGYYNQGSHFTCRMCETTFWVQSEDEIGEEYEGSTTTTDNLITLADFDSCEPEGYST